MDVTKDMNLGVKMLDPIADEHTVRFGSDQPVEGHHGPGGSPYVTYLVMPRFIWEAYGCPKEIVVQVKSGNRMRALEEE